jgi:hypothetical protein
MMKPPLDFELLKAVADSLRLANGRNPTVEEVARAYVVIHEVAEALRSDRFEFLPPVDLALGGARADDYYRPRPRLEVVE